MMRLLCGLLLVVVGCGASSFSLPNTGSDDGISTGSPADRETGTLRVVNNSTAMIEAFYVALSEAPGGWGENLLGTERVFRGRARDFGIEVGRYDLAVDLSDADCSFSAEQWGVTIESGEVYEFVLSPSTPVLAYGECGTTDGINVENVLAASWQIFAVNENEVVRAGAFAVDETLLATK